MQSQSDSLYFPKVPLWRRGAAFAIDFSIVWLLCLFSGSLFLVIFLLSWGASRLLIPAKNRGQSLGRYAFDLRTVDWRGRTPGFLELCKRESLIGLGVMLALVGIANLSPTNAWALLLPIPLLVDCGFAFADAEAQQAFHDRIAQTLVVQSRRGYSLDLKMKRLLAQFNTRVRK